MKRLFNLFTLVTTLVFVLGFVSCSKISSGVIDPKDFKNPPSSVRMHTWWHWIGGHITKAGITKDLEAMKAQGIIQATIFNAGYFEHRDFGVKRVLFGTDEWYEMFRWALQEAHRLGITIGVASCDGWSESGGPWITPEMSQKQFVWTKTIVEGEKKIKIQLPQPFSNLNYYRDVAVVAYKTRKRPNSFHLAKPTISLNDTTNASILMDGNPVSGLPVKSGDYLSIAFPSSFAFGKIALHPRRSFDWSNLDIMESGYTIAVSSDGQQFKELKEIKVTGMNQTVLLELPPTSARFVRITIGTSTVNYSLSELELLSGDEMPLFAPVISHYGQKIISTKGEKGAYYYPEYYNRMDSGNIADKEIVLLTEKMSPDGSLKWEAPAGTWEVIRFGYTTTGKTNSPASKEGTGLECDKMDAAALDVHFNSFPKKLCAKAEDLVGNTFKFILLDSYEAEFFNWTANFPAEFEKRRGYSLIPWLPVLCGEIVGTVAESESVLFDFRKTIADLIERNYYKHYTELCHKEKLELHAEVFDEGPWCPPLDILKTNNLVDLSMCEFWSSTNLNPGYYMQPCASIGYNKPILGAEAYTNMADYSESPNSLSPFGNIAFCDGVNQLILHSYVHQPIDKKPGLTLGKYGRPFNRNNLYWPYMSEWFKYQTRIMYILQKGVTVPDVLFYIGDQLPEFYEYGTSTSLPFGYKINTCNFDILKNRVEVINGKLRMNNVSDYAILSLPSFPFMDFETLKLIESLVKGGAIVYGPKPLQPLSRVDVSANLSAFHELADKVWGKVDGKSVLGNSYGEGKIFWGLPLGEVLKRINLEHDFAVTLPVKETLSFIHEKMKMVGVLPYGVNPEKNTFQFIHKKMGDTDVYFVANQLDSAINSECLFRVGEKTPEIWDPEDGSVVKPAIFRQENGQVRIPFNFKPYQSTLFVFKPGKPVDFITTVLKDGRQIFPASKGEENVEVPLVTYEKDGMFLNVFYTGNYKFKTQNNKTLTGQYFQPKEMEITNFKGNIQFEAGYPATIAPVEITTLKPLTDFENPDIRYFSGNAKYTINFQVPENFIAGKETILLNVGNFESVGEVWLNNKPLGKIWKPGTDLNISGILKTNNQLVVTIANVYRNRFIGDFVQYGKVQNLWTSSPIEQFLDKDKPLKPSGLMGPLKVIKKSSTKILM